MRYAIEINIVYLDDSKEPPLQTSPGGMTVAFDSEAALWEHFRKLRDVDRLCAENDQAREGLAEVHRALRELEASILAQRDRVADWPALDASAESSPATDRPALRADAPVAPLPHSRPDPCEPRPHPDSDQNALSHPERPTTENGIDREIQRMLGLLWQHHGITVGDIAEYMTEYHRKLVREALK